MHRILGTALACSTLLLTTGCGDDARDVAPRAQDPSATTTPSQVPVPTSSPTKTPSDGLEKVRVVGTVTQVGDCVVVRDDNAITWTMAGDLAADLRLDDRVQVSGAPDLAATGCGGPLVRVVRVQVLPSAG